MAIIGCRLFEDELVHVLSRDEDLDELFVVDDDESGDLRRKLAESEIEAKISPVAVERLPKLRRPAGFSAIVWVKPMALHQKPEKLREDVLDSIVKLGPLSDSILLFYGLCGNAFKKIDEDVLERNARVAILRDARGQIVDDCIGCALGGTEEYFDRLKKSHGTFFLTPMWAANWRELFHKVQILPDPNDVEGAKYIFQCVGYKKVLKMETGLGDQGRFEHQVAEFSGLFDFERDSIRCDPNVVETSYEDAKREALGAHAPVQGRESDLGCGSI